MPEPVAPAPEELPTDESKNDDLPPATPSDSADELPAEPVADATETPAESEPAVAEPESVL